jgi:hypothetical protein
MAGALIVTAVLDAADFAWLDGLRRKHYPPERNRVSAHLTILHALPPSAEAELRSRLAEAAKAPRPKARIEGLTDLGGGVAFRVASLDLDRIRDNLTDGLHGMLGQQDRGGWRPHVTVQNKVAATKARALLASLEGGFIPRPLAIRGLGLHRYLDGPWERVAIYAFRGG